MVSWLRKQKKKKSETRINRIEHCVKEIGFQL